MNLALMMFFMACGGVIQAVAPVWTTLGQAKIPVLAGIVVYYALARGRGDMLRAAILAGLVQDGLGLTPFGYSSFVFCAAGLLVGRFRDVVFVHESLTHLIFGMLAAAGSTLGLFLLLTGANLVEISPWQAFHKAAGSALLGAAATPFIFHGCSRMEEWLGLAAKPDTTWQHLP